MIHVVANVAGMELTDKHHERDRLQRTHVVFDHPPPRHSSAADRKQLLQLSLKRMPEQN